MSFLPAVITGLALGSMYGLLALGFHVTYAVSGTVNFSQGSSMTLGAVAGYFFLVLWGWPAAAGVPAVLLVCAVYGLLIERFAVRPFVQRGSDNWLMATVAVGIIVDNVMLFVFGKEPRSFPSVLAAKPIQIVEGAGVYPLQLLIPVVGLLLALALHLLSRRTRRGVAMLAVVQNPNAARLMGINVERRYRRELRGLGDTGGCRGVVNRAAVQRFLRDGHLVRHQGLCSCDYRWPRKCLGCDVGGTLPRADRSVRDQLSRLGLHPNHYLRLGDPHSRRPSPRAARPSRS